MVRTINIIFMRVSWSRKNQSLQKISRTQLLWRSGRAVDRTTSIIILVRLSTWKSTNDKSVRSEWKTTLDTSRTIAIEPCSHGRSFCRSVMHDRSAENLCLRRARKNDPFIRYQNMEILLRWCLGLLRETSTHLESVILPWVKPAYPLVVSSPSRILHLLPPSRSPISLSVVRTPRIRAYLVIFVLSTANKFTFASGKCHFIVRRRNNLSKFSPKDINKKADSSAGSGRLTRPPMPAGFRRGSQIRCETDFRQDERGAQSTVGSVSGNWEISKVCTTQNVEWVQPGTPTLQTIWPNRAKWKRTVECCARNISLSSRGYAALRALCTSPARAPIVLDFNLTSSRFDLSWTWSSFRPETLHKRKSM